MAVEEGPASKGDLRCRLCISKMGGTSGWSSQSNDPDQPDPLEKNVKLRSLLGLPPGTLQSLSMLPICQQCRHLVQVFGSFIDRSQEAKGLWQSVLGGARGGQGLQERGRRRNRHQRRIWSLGQETGEETKSLESAANHLKESYPLLYSMGFEDNDINNVGEAAVTIHRKGEPELKAIGLGGSVRRPLPGKVPIPRLRSKPVVAAAAAASRAAVRRASAETIPRDAGRTLRDRGLLRRQQEQVLRPPEPIFRDDDPVLSPLLPSDSDNDMMGSSPPRRAKVAISPPSGLFVVPVFHQGSDGEVSDISGIPDPLWSSLDIEMGGPAEGVVIKREYEDEGFWGDPSLGSLAEPPAGKLAEGGGHLAEVEKVVVPVRREFACSFAHCSRTYSKLHLLVEHERKHTGERPFRCPGCGRRFSRVTDLKKHRLLAVCSRK